MTQQGMAGIKTQQRPGRAVTDVSYYRDEVQRKVRELQRVIGDMNTEIERLQQSSQQQQHAEHHLESVVNEIREQQGKLTDLNIVLDKAQTNSLPSELQQQIIELRSRNDASNKEVDDLVTQRLETEKRVKRTEDNISEKQQEVQETLEQLDNSMRAQYEQLQGENANLTQDIQRQEHQRDNLRQEVDSLERDLMHDSFKQRALELCQKIRTEKQRRSNLQAQQEETASPEDERQRLKTQVKRENEEVQRIEKELQRVTQEVRRAERSQKSRVGSQTRAQSQYQSSSAEAPDLDSHNEQIKEKEPQFQEFIDNFSDNFQRVESEKRQRKDNIVKALNRVSQSLQARSNLPDLGTLDETTDELEYKQLQMESAMSMQENSTEERKLRQAELDKMNNLEMKIQSELESLDSRMERMREEKKQYAKLDELRDSAERRGKQLENEKEALQRQSEMLDVVVGQKKQEYEAKCVQLADNDTHNQVEKLQERLMMLGQGIYQTRRDVEAKERENQHGELSKQVLETCESLNRLNNASAS